MTDFCPHDRKSFPRRCESSAGLLGPPRVNQPFVFKQGGGMKPGQVSATRWCSQIRISCMCQLKSVFFSGLGVNVPLKAPVCELCANLVDNSCPLYVLFNPTSVRVVVSLRWCGISVKKIFWTYYIMMGIKTIPPRMWHESCSDQCGKQISCFRVKNK